MFKNKSKIIVILTTIILMFSFSFCYAENEVTGESQIQPRTDGVVTETHEIKNEDVYLIGDDIIIDYIVDGNLFVMGENVTIKSEIGGDAFILANSLNIDGGSIYSNLFACADTININGIIYDLYAMSNTLTISNDCYIYRDARISADTLNVYGTIGRNVYANFENISFTQDSNNGKIYGNFEYNSSSEVDTTNFVVGESKFNQLVEESEYTYTDYIFNAIKPMVFCLIIWLLLKWLAPKFINNSQEVLTKKLLPSIGFGILGLIIIPIISVILLILNVTANFGLLLLTIYVLLLALSSTIFTISLSKVIVKKLNKENNFGIELLIVVLSSIAIYFAKLLPYVGTFLSFAFILIGLGIIIKSILPIKNKVIEKVEE